MESKQQEETSVVTDQTSTNIIMSTDSTMQDSKFQSELSKIVAKILSAVENRTKIMFIKELRQALLEKVTQPEYQEMVNSLLDLNDLEGCLSTTHLIIHEDLQNFEKSGDDAIMAWMLEKDELVLEDEEVAQFLILYLSLSRTLCGTLREIFLPFENDIQNLKTRIFQVLSATKTKFRIPRPGSDKAIKLFNIIQEHPIILDSEQMSKEDFDASLMELGLLGFDTDWPVSKIKEDINKGPFFMFQEIRKFLKECLIISQEQNFEQETPMDTSTSS